MLGLNQDSVNLIVVVAVVHVIPIIGICIAALLSRQVFRFGLSQNWGSSESTDLKLHGY